ncbi:MAG: penicillin-binding transpeptidase domain-containing protein [Vicinamibacteria bacterium]
MREERLVRLRLMLVSLSVSLWALGIGVRLFQLQVLERGFFEKQAARQSERTINIDPRRGPILDRNGHQLAVSVDAQSVYAVPQDVDDPKATAQALARALGLDGAGRRELQAQLSRNRAFVWIKRKLDPGTAGAVRDLELPGVGFITESKRYYPQRELGAHVLGWVGLDNAGMSGIEYAFDAQMRGRAAKVVVRTDARRAPIEHIEKPSTEGHTLVLTLDEAIQHIAEVELEAAVAQTGAQAGVLIVMEPRSGEILALANRPTFNPNRFGATSSARWRNRAVADSFEPGSIFKIVTAAAALQEKVVSPDEVLDCGGGGIEIAGVRINDHGVFNDLRFREVISRSSDVGVIRVAQRLGRENFNRYVRGFGFGAPTGIELPGEASGLLRPTAKWSALSLPSMSFGQEIGVTALQFTAATAAVANGGYLMRPTIVKRIEDRDGRVVKETKPLVVRRVLEPETVDTLTELLRGVVRDGTGKKAALTGFTVAGKTGTAQKIDASGRYSMVEHVASFAGFVPAARPALVILAALDEPKGEHNEGGDVAAPLFARVAERALRQLAVPPEDPSRVLRPLPFSTQALLSRAAYSPPVPAPEAEPVDEPGRMPDLRGQPAREAAIAAARRGLTVELRGSGRVVAQTPDPGVEIEAGLTCVLTLSRDGGEPRS